MQCFFTLIVVRFPLVSVYYVYVIVAPLFSHWLYAYPLAFRGSLLRRSWLRLLDIKLK